MKKNASGEEKVKDNKDSEEIYCASGSLSPPTSDEDAVQKWYPCVYIIFFPSYNSKKIVKKWYKQKKIYNNVTILKFLR